MNNQLILLGGGASIKDGLTLGLWDKLKDKFVIGTNYSYNYFTPTVLACVDWKFYDKEREKLKNLPLIITRQRKKTTDYMPNTIRLETSMQYTRDLSGGIYSGVLTGIFSLSLAIYLLESGDIFLLGYDFTKEKRHNEIAQTHFYQGQINHRGIGKIDYYRSHSPNDIFTVYSGETKIKIYNVSMNSTISNFSKIDYTTFFSMLNNNICNQEELRKEIIEKLSKLSKT